MVDLDEITLVKLAREMAMNIRPVKLIFADFGINEDDYYEITKIEYFSRAKEHFLLEWNSTLGTADRLKFQNQAGLEILMPHLFKRALDPKSSLNEAVEVAKQAAKLGGVGEAKTSDKPSAERFQITINLGADVDGKPIIEKFDKSVTIDPNDIVTGYDSATSRNFPQLTATPDPTAYEAALESLMKMED